MRPAEGEPLASPGKRAPEAPEPCIDWKSCGRQRLCQFFGCMCACMETWPKAALCWLTFLLFVSFCVGSGYWTKWFWAVSLRVQEAGKRGPGT